ncbi:MAG: di-heme oxidoredictase family protein [Pseudomonadota bacterium]
MTHRFAAALALLAAPALVFAADRLADPHPTAVPRTAAEAARIAAVTAPTTEFGKPEAFETNSAGAATIPARAAARGFLQPAGNIDFDRRLEFELGNAMFEKLWVSSPSSTLASDGLGPLFNARSCRRCHVANGRGHPPLSGDDSRVSMVMRLAVPAPQTTALGILDDQAARPDPTYGAQLQDLGIAGMPAEGSFDIAYEEIRVPLSEGEEAWLRNPTYSLRELNYGDAHPDLRLSPRIAQQMIGLGLLDAIPTADILANADPDDSNGDGISGRAQIVQSHEYGAPMLGRFGHKAGQPTLRQQVAAAFHGDIGISSTLFSEGYGDCMPGQTRCRIAPDGSTEHHDNREIGDIGLDLTTFYAATIGVPARRDVGDAEVLRGKAVFYETGCISCHTPKFVTHRLPDQPEQSFQLIWPYTDLLLHDMGPGLADNSPEGRANGQEWRTPPLWGIGLTAQVSGHSFFLHDGRARSLLEAVLWHGGEAEAQKTRVIEMPKADRDALIRFLESL